VPHKQRDEPVLAIAAEREPSAVARLEGVVGPAHHQDPLVKFDESEA
jgi:hypothetical protein